jgi:hypothetical protein
MKVFSTTPARRYSPFCASYKKEALSQVVIHRALTEP